MTVGRLVQDLASPQEISDLRLLIEGFLNIDLSEQIARPERNLLAGDEALIRLAWRYYLLDYPLQYLLGYAYFYGHKFLVQNNVLIPRFDSEFLVKAGLDLVQADFAVLDLCCGSGCLGISLALEARPLKFKLHLADLSLAALDLSQSNLDLHQVKAKLIQSDLFAQIKTTYDLIICNPPYISEPDYLDLEPRVKLFEPALALKAGRDGLDFYREILAQVSGFLKPQGKLILEHGQGQREAILEMIDPSLLKISELIDDYAGIDRCIIIENK